ncbi:MAG: hypothetical protein QXU87_09395 [Candidatus Caldarchaeum sp.]
MKKQAFDPEQISSGLTFLLESIGVNIPFASEILNTAIKKWLGDLAPENLEKYMSVIRAAKRSGSYLRRRLDTMLETFSSEDKVIIIPLFTAFLLANILQPLEANDR